MEEDKQYQIDVDVRTNYVKEQSAPELNRFVFAYTITIRNEGAIPAKLLSRHWLITDAHGNVQEVRGIGVVGEQPYLKPGEGFQYTSGTVLETPVGSMEGKYQMVADDDTEFEAIIPAFTLSVPHALH
ncbi:MAG: Co2+/Mg2+ efflux protein ApaG [Gammaproteobacteria bacterium]|nr:Co2+/Mg2+ efflux protein ApaG [Gammaproteobacteria bacterium]